MITIKTLYDTYFKTKPKQSNELGDDDMVFIPADKNLDISSYDYHPDNLHLHAYSDRLNIEFYAFLGHIKIFKDGILVSRDLLSQAQLEAIAPNSDLDRLTQLLPYLNQTMQRYAITSPLRMAHYLAQTAHESDGYNTNEEYASGADYEGRRDLGNNKSGDGVRFKGRGLIQVTGRTNYGECGEALGIDLINNPTKLADFDLACFSAGWYWGKNNLNTYADNDDILTITQIINGGDNGLDQRQEYLDRAKGVFGI